VLKGVNTGQPLEVPEINPSAALKTWLEGLQVSIEILRTAAKFSLA
jgi:hypothetical protein